MNSFDTVVFQTNNFIISKHLKCASQDFYVDDENKKFAIVSISKIAKGFTITTNSKVDIYDFSHLLNFELKENGNVIVESKSAATAIGGLAFGPLGAAIAATGAKKHESTCSSLLINLMINNLSSPHVTVECIKSETKKSSPIYKNSLESANTLIGILTYIKNYNIQHPQDSSSECPPPKSFIDPNPPKKKYGWLFFIMLIFCLAMAILLLNTTTPDSDNANSLPATSADIVSNISSLPSLTPKNIQVLIDAQQFSNITQKELISIMGKAENTEKGNWIVPSTNKKVKYTCLIYNNGNYEFMFIDSKLVRFNWYANVDLSKEDIYDIAKMFAIEPNVTMKELAATGVALRYGDINDKVDEIWIVGPLSDGDNSCIVKITYNMKWFK